MNQSDRHQQEKFLRKHHKIKKVIQSNYKQECSSHHQCSREEKPGKPKVPIPLEPLGSVSSA